MNRPSQNDKLKSKKLREETQQVVTRWVDTPYYDAVEGKAVSQWNSLIAPFLSEFELNTSVVLELAVGHGRMTQILLENSDKVIGVDVLQENIDFCKKRFTNTEGLELLKNDGVDLGEIASDSVTFVFCFDSMIHFDSDVVRSYLSEFSRILKSGCYAFLHHSNLSKNPGGNFQKNAHARNFMSVELFSHYAQKEGLKVVKQEKVTWGTGEKRVKDLDGFTLLQKP